MKIRTIKGDLDLYNGFNYSFNYSVQELSDITKRKTNFSRQIKVPATDKNLLIFGLADLLEVEFTNFDPLEKLSCIVQSENMTIFEGFIQLDSVDFNGVEKSINIVIYSQTINLIDAIRGVNLSDLDWSEYDHNYNVNSGGDVFQSIGGNIRYYGNLVPRSPGRGYVYPFANYGSYNEDDNLILSNDLRPAVFLGEYIDKIFNFAGIGYKSEFFNTEYFKNILIPCTAEFKISDEEANDRKVDVYNSVDQSFSYIGGTIFNLTDEQVAEYDSENQDILNQYNTTTNQITISNTGVYELAYETKMKVETIISTSETYYKTPIECSFLIYVNGALYDTNNILIDEASVTLPTTGTYTDEFVLSGDVSKDFTAGDVVEIRYKFTKFMYYYYSGGVLGSKDYLDCDVDFIGNKLTATYSDLNETIQFGDDFKFSNCVPTIEADKFLKSIITLFNLYIIEEGEVLRIESRDEFYNSKIFHEWDQLHDKDKAFNIEIASKEIPKNYEFNLKNGESYLIETNNTFNNETFSYSSDFESVSVSKNKYGVRLPDLKDIGLSMLFYNGVDIENLVNYGTIGNTAPIVKIDDILYIQEYPEFSLKYGGSVYFDLYKLFYLNNINDLKNKDSKIFTGYFNLNNLQINSLSLRDRIFFKGAFWRILKIEDFNPEGNESVKVQLFKLEGNYSYLTAEEQINSVYENSGVFSNEFNNIFA